MRILSFEVVGLFGRDGTISSKLHEDLNVLTGKNGVGKTSILKLLWYIMSGNILIALREIPFSKAVLTTTEYQCVIFRKSRLTCKIEFTVGSQKMTFEDDFDEDGNIESNAEDQANQILRGTGDSVFLPTFRRIEGGFTMGVARGNTLNRLAQAKNDVEDSLTALASKLSQKKHTFVCSISTTDVSDLLLKKYSELSDTYTDIQQATSQEIINTIKAFKSDKDVTKLDAANEIIDQIRAKVESMEAKREEIMTPIEGVRQMVAMLFRHSGIKISNRLNFGDAANAVNSEALSAGEKQMLSFICYNAFYKNSVIFIDEPELSLHVDWQRQLFFILGQQSSSNQFVIATHSPFIYSKYPEKEIEIGIDKGDGGFE